MNSRATLWDPVPRDLSAELVCVTWTPETPAPQTVVYLWVWRQVMDGRTPSIRDVAGYACRGKTWAARVRSRAIADAAAWSRGETLAVPFGTPAGHPRDTDGTPDTDDSDIVEEERDTRGTPAGHPRDTSRARDPSADSTRTITETPNRPAEPVSPTAQEQAPAPEPTTTPEPTPEPTPKPKPEPTDDDDSLRLGSGVKRSKVTPDVEAVYRAWQSRQMSPRSCRLTAPRLRLLTRALRDYSVEEIRDVVDLAYTAPVGESSLPERFARAWRGEAGDGAPGLEMLLRGEHLARNVEMAARWRTTHQPEDSAMLRGSWAHMQRVVSATTSEPHRLHADDERSALLTRAVQMLGGWARTRSLVQSHPEAEPPPEWRAAMYGRPVIVASVTEQRGHR